MRKKVELAVFTLQHAVFIEMELKLLYITLPLPQSLSDIFISTFFGGYK